MNALFLSRSLLTVTLVAFMLATVPCPSHAGIISTTSSVGAATSLDRSANLARIQSQLNRAEVQEQLVKFGVPPDRAMERVATLSDTEIAGLADRMDKAPVGGDVGLFGLLGVIFVVLLVLDYTGTIHIFSHRR
jgi:hypothetical protein